MTTALAQAQPLDFCERVFPWGDRSPRRCRSRREPRRLARSRDREHWPQHRRDPRESSRRAGVRAATRDCRWRRSVRHRRGDLNRDGIPDLIVTTPDGGAIEVLLMAGNGQVASRSLVAPGSQAWGATLSDATRDGILDDLHRLRARSRRAAARHRHRRFRGRSRRMGRGCKASGRRRP